MPVMNVVLDDDPWPDLKGREADVIHVTNPISVARIRGGMESGKASVMMRIDLPDGRVALAETSVDLWNMATAAFRGAEQRDADLARHQRRTN